MEWAAEFRAVSASVHVRTARREQTNTTVVELGGGEVLLVDPAIEASDMQEIADQIKSRGWRVALGWSTHPHWDHVLWSKDLGADVVRYATRKNAELCAKEKAELEGYIGKSAPGHETALCGSLRPIEEAGEEWPGGIRLIAHDGHAPGHGALFVEEEGVLIAGDMVSDIEIPSLELESEDPVGPYEEALDLFEGVACDLENFVPGHGAVGDRTELLGRIALDRRYLGEIRSGREITDPRPRAEWLERHHQEQAAWCKENL